MLWESSFASDDRFAGKQHAAQIPRFTLRGIDGTWDMVYLNGVSAHRGVFLRRAFAMLGLLGFFFEFSLAFGVVHQDDLSLAVFARDQRQAAAEF